MTRTASSAKPARSPVDLETAIEAAEDQLRTLRALHARRHVELPLRFWRQQAHLTTPAAEEATARKALQQGTAPMERILDRFGVTGQELAERLEVPEGRSSRSWTAPPWRRSSCSKGKTHRRFETTWPRKASAARLAS